MQSNTIYATYVRTVARTIEQRGPPADRTRSGGERVRCFFGPYAQANSQVRRRMDGRSSRQKHSEIDLIGLMKRWR